MCKRLGRRCIHQNRIYEIMMTEPACRCATTQGDTVIFASLWESLEAIQTRFGADWQVSFLPEGYEDMIAECSVRHIDLSGGWHAEV